MQQQGFYKNSKVDGRWGPQTRRAVQSFQQAKGMPATGQLDEQTLGALGVNKQSEKQIGQGVALAAPFPAKSVLPLAANRA